MSRMKRLVRAFAIATMVASIPFAAFAGKPSGGGSQTAQSIMVAINGVHAGTYAAHANNTYHYNETTAATYFTNTLTSGPVASCNGSPTACADSNQPAAPGAPAPAAGELNGSPQGHPGAVDQNKCRFLDGLTLNGHTYTQSSGAVNGLNGSGNWKFTWTYTVAPTSADPVAPFTAWDLVNTTGSGQVHLNVGADVMGESAMQNQKMTQPKFSFSMGTLDPYGNTVENRVDGLTLTLDGTVIASGIPSSVVYAPAPNNVDFSYTANAGYNGATGILYPTPNTLGSTILGSDGFKGNDLGGSDGSGLAKVVMSKIGVDVGEGPHSLTLTGSVKGNAIDGASTGASISFTVNTQINVITPGCGGGPN